MGKIFITAIVVVVCIAGSPKNKMIQCNEPKKDIIYILPKTVENKLKKYFDSCGYSQAYLYMYSQNNIFELYVSPIDKSSTAEFIINSNRKVFVGGFFYPLIFESDNIFATAATTDEVLAEYKQNGSVNRKEKYIIQHGFNVKFDSQGRITDDGF